METYEPYMRRINKLEGGIAAAVPVLANLKEFMARPQTFDPQYEPIEHVQWAIDILQQAIKGSIRDPGPSEDNPS